MPVHGVALPPIRRVGATCCVSRTESELAKEEWLPARLNPVILRSLVPQLQFTRIAWAGSSATTACTEDGLVTCSEY